MAETTYKAFLSCSFAPENVEINEFFERLVAAVGFEPIVYNYQEIGRLADKIKEHIVKCDCLIAVVAKSRKIEGTEHWAASDWIHDELALANAFQKPIAIFCEDVVQIQGLVAAEERRQAFSRDRVLEAVPDLVRFLFNLRSYLASAVPTLPVLLRHFVHVKEEVRSADVLVERVEVLMECLAQELEATFHSNELDETTAGLSIRPRDFKFVCKEAPFNMKVEPVVVRSTESKHLWRINFSPPLKKGEKVRYAFKIVRQNSRPWTMDQIEKRIQQGTYHFKERHCGACEWVISYPTVQFLFEIEFPEGYEIRDTDVDVKAGEADLRADTEVRRIRDGGMFTAEKIIDKWALSLRVSKPLQDHKYIITYAPAL